MDTPMIRATWQSGCLSAISNILGQAISCHQSNKNFDLNLTDLFHFVLFAVLSCPPNFVWQIWLESKFPGYTTESKGEGKRQDGITPSYKAEKTGDATKPDYNKKLNIRNTAIKFALDQTLGAAVNTVLFLGGIALLKGKPSYAIITDCREQFWPLMLAGQKLWPAVSLMSFLLVPVEHRMIFGNIIGLFWGIYLSLISSSGRAS